MGVSFSIEGKKDWGGYRRKTYILRLVFGDGGEITFNSSISIPDISIVQSRHVIPESQTTVYV